MKIKIFFSVIIILLVVSNGLAQDITNTLAPNGSFKITDGSTDYLSLSQTTGYLSLNRSLVLPNSTSLSIGVIYKGADRFIHNYQSASSFGENLFAGVNAGNFTMSGSAGHSSYNTGIGVYSLFTNTTGYQNTALGHGSLSYNTTGFDNTAIGAASLVLNGGGYQNTAVGSQSLYLNISGFDNTAIGFQSLYSNTDGIYNTAVGMNSLYSNNTGIQNTATGYNALYSNTTGQWNTAMGNESLFWNNVGNANTAVGHQSLFSNTTGFGNTALGDESLISNTTGFQNTAIGALSLQLNTTGNQNTAVGNSTGSTITTGYNLTLVGYNATPTIGTAINQITLGNNQVTSLRCNVTTITSLSDARDKKNITDLTLGLDFITKLKPRQFYWDKREWYDGNQSDGSKMQETPTAGFIAQEFDEIQKSENAEWLNLVLKDNSDKWEATYGNLLPVMVKAIQELKIKNEQLKIEKDNEIAELKSRLAKYEEMQTILVKRFEQFEANEQLFKIQIVNAENNN